MLDIRVLGALNVIDGGVDVTPHGDLQRTLLAALLLEAGRPVSPDRLAEELWGEALPGNYVGALQTQVFRLRKRLASLRIERLPAGYLVDLGDHRLDVAEFESLVTNAFATRVDDPRRALDMLDRALAMWRGEPFLELESEPAHAGRVRLEELRLRAIEERIEIQLTRGAAAEVIGDLEAQALANPTRERVHAQLARALTATGRAVDALQVFDRFRRTLGDELGIEPSPQFRALNDEIVTGTLTFDRAELETTRSRVPRYATPLVGRQAALEDVVRLAASERLVTLLGTGGVGKTRLAAEAAMRLDEVFDGNVVWCDLASSSTADVLEAVGAELGVEAHAGERMVDRIVSALGHGPSLLVLDNCEHVIEQAAVLSQRIVSSTDSVHLVTTSRERLAVDGEHLLVVEPLSLDEGDARPAVDLFLQRASAAGADLGQDAATRSLLSTLCNDLGGLPLAIELAAAQLYTMELDLIVREIGRGLGVLSGQRRSSDRHRSLAAAMQWSYDLLTEDERRSFANLAVFRAAFDADAAAATMGCEVDEAHARLRSLAERSLLQRIERRWLMLEPLRQFAAEVWDDAAELDRARARHAAYHVARSEQLRDLLAGSDPGSAMRAFDRLLPELRAAHAHLVKQSHVEGLVRLAFAVETYGMCRPRNEVMTWGLPVAELDPLHPSAGEMLAFAAYSAWGRASREQFGELATQALDRSRRNHGTATAFVASVMGLQSLISGELQESLDWYAMAMDATDPTDLIRRSEISVTYLLALAYSGDPRATDWAEQTLEEFDGSPSVLAAAWAWYGAGEAYVEIDPQLAMRRLQRAVDVSKGGEAWFVAGAAGASLASLEARVGNARRAVELYEWLLPLWARTGDTSVVWTAMRSISALLFQLDQPDSAATLLEAVRTTSDGHRVFGIDIDRLDNLERALREQIGTERFEAAARKGRGLDAAAVTDLAMQQLAVRR